MKRTVDDIDPSAIKKVARIIGPHELDDWEMEAPEFAEARPSPLFFNYIMERIERELWDNRVYFAGARPRPVTLYWVPQVDGYQRDYDDLYKHAPRTVTMSVNGESFKLAVIRTLEASGYHVVLSQPGFNFYLKIRPAVPKQ